MKNRNCSTFLATGFGQNGERCSNEAALDGHQSMAIKWVTLRWKRWIWRWLGKLTTKQRVQMLSLRKMPTRHRR